MSAAPRLNTPTHPLAPLRARLLAVQLAFNQRQPRERVLMSVVAVFMALALADTLWISPAWKAYRSAQQKQQQVRDTQQQLQRDIAQLGPALKGQSEHRRAEVHAWRERVHEGETALRRQEDTLLGPDQMMAVLEQVLARHGQVQVRAMRSLDRVDLLASEPVQAIPGAPPTPASAPAAATGYSTAAIRPAPPALANALRQHPEAKAAGPGAPTIYRHGVELVLEGSFNDLLAYLHALENMPQHVLWGPMGLQVQQYPVSRLTLRLYTVSRQRHWLAF